MKNKEIKLIMDDKIAPQANRTILKKIRKYLDNPMGDNTIKINTKSLEQLSTAISFEFDCTVQNYVSGGCYGARDGKTYEGITLWVSADELPERILDDGIEYYNPWKAFHKNGELFELDAENLIDICEHLSLDVKCDNSYNWSGNDNEVETMFDFDFKVVELNDKCLFVVKFHCGGDARGNYTEDYVFKFKSMDDFYSVLYPTSYLKEEAV